MRGTIEGLFRSWGCCPLPVHKDSSGKLFFPKADRHFYGFWPSDTSPWGAWASAWTTDGLFDEQMYLEAGHFRQSAQEIKAISPSPDFRNPETTPEPSATLGHMSGGSIYKSGSFL